MPYLVSNEYVQLKHQTDIYLNLKMEGIEEIINFIASRNRKVGKTLALYVANPSLSLALHTVP